MSRLFYHFDGLYQVKMMRMSPRTTVFGYSPKRAIGHSKWGRKAIGSLQEYSITPPLGDIVRADRAVSGELKTEENKDNRTCKSSVECGGKNVYACEAGGISEYG